MAKMIRRSGEIHLGTKEGTACGAAPRVYPEQNYSNVTPSLRGLRACREMHERICETCWVIANEA